MHLRLIIETETLHLYLLQCYRSVILVSLFFSVLYPNSVVNVMIFNVHLSVVFFFSRAIYSICILYYIILYYKEIQLYLVRYNPGRRMVCPVIGKKKKTNNKFLIL